jgi:hypothetical protein
MSRVRGMGSDPSGLDVATATTDILIDDRDDLITTYNTICFVALCGRRCA